MIFFMGKNPVVEMLDMVGVGHDRDYRPPGITHVYVQNRKIQCHFLEYYYIGYDCLHKSVDICPDAYTFPFRTVKYPIQPIGYLLHIRCSSIGLRPRVHLRR